MRFSRSALVCTLNAFSKGKPHSSIQIVFGLVCSSLLNPPSDFSFLLCLCFLCFFLCLLFPFSFAGDELDSESECFLLRFLLLSILSGSLSSPESALQASASLADSSEELARAQSSTLLKRCTSDPLKLEFVSHSLLRSEKMSQRWRKGCNSANNYVTISKKLWSYSQLEEIACLYLFFRICRFLKSQYMGKGMMVLVVHFPSLNTPILTVELETTDATADRRLPPFWKYSQTVRCVRCNPRD